MTSVDDLMDRISDMIREDPETVRRFGAACKFALSGEGARTFVVDMHPGNPRVIDGDGEAQCTIKMPASEFIKLAERQANPRALFFSGKLRVKGDFRLAMKLNKLFVNLGRSK
jgi:putative sterol carrier protein